MRVKELRELIARAALLAHSSYGGIWPFDTKNVLESVEYSNEVSEVRELLCRAAGFIDENGHTTERHRDEFRKLREKIKARSLRYGS